MESMITPSDVDDVIIRMVEDVISRCFLNRQHPETSVSAWLPPEAVEPMRAALELEGEARLSAILDVLDEHVTAGVTRKFLIWDATPKMLAGP